MMHSPLRYPGGKSDFLSTAAEIYTKGNFVGRPIVEPYAGSAAVSLGLLDLDLTPRVTLVERDPLLYCFWKALFRHTSELIVAFQSLPINLDSWLQIQPLLRLREPDERKIVQLGLAALFLNRTNFSGILNAGPIGGKGQKSKYKIDCRTNKDEIISRILALAMLGDRVDVHFGDAVDFIKQKKNVRSLFFYLDPPYFNKGDLLYRYYYGVHDHKRLAESLVDAKFDWLLSYDDHHIIEFLYKDFNVSRLEFRYSAHSPRNHFELLISNFSLPLKNTHLRKPPRRARSPLPA